MEPSGKKKKKEEGFKELQVHTEPQTTNLSHLKIFFFLSCTRQGAKLT